MVNWLQVHKTYVLRAHSWYVPQLFDVYDHGMSSPVLFLRSTFAINRFVAKHLLVVGGNLGQCFVTCCFRVSICSTKTLGLQAACGRPCCKSSDETKELCFRITYGHGFSFPSVVLGK